MNGSTQALAGVARLFRFAIVSCCLLIAGVQAHADGVVGLSIPMDGLFPAERTQSTSQPLWLAQASSDAQAKAAWESALPPTEEFDWVKMTSGEWLKGEMKVLYSGTLEFDSDEFDLQKLDWDDVADLYGHGTKRLSFDTSEGLIHVDGVITVTGDKVIVENAEGTKEYKRSDLISITPGARTEWDNWSAKISLGLNFSSGNTEQTDYTSKMDIRRRTPENRLVFEYLGNYSKSGDAEIANNHRGNTYFDLFAAKEYFWRPIFAEYYRDPFQNLDNRTTIGVGAGYHIIDTPKTTWDVSGGPAYRWTQYVSVQPPDEREVTTPALVASTVYDTKLTDNLDFNGQYAFSIVNEESGTYTHHAIATFEIELTEILDFDVSFVWDRTENPQTRADGTTPKQDDFQLLLTLGVDI